MRYIDDTLLLAKEVDIIYIFGKFNASIFRDNSSNSSSVQSNWNCKTSKIKSLYHRAKKICSSKEKFKYRIDKIKICHRTVIYLTLLILLSSYLKAILTTIEMKRQMTKRKLSELDYLILDK